MLRRLFAVTIALGCAACEYGPDTSPSQGLCTGAVGTRPLDGVIDAQQSEYHLEGEVFVVNLSYLRGGFRATGVADGVFTANAHTYALATPWVLQAPADRPETRGGEVTVKYVTPYRLKGSLTVESADGTRACCDFDLRRATDLEDGLE